jgi:hypothetical protein
VSIRFNRTGGYVSHGRLGEAGRLKFLGGFLPISLPDNNLLAAVVAAGFILYAVYTGILKKYLPLVSSMRRDAEKDREAEEEKPLIATPRFDISVKAVRGYR